MGWSIQSKSKRIKIINLRKKGKVRQRGMKSKTVRRITGRREGEGGRVGGSFGRFAQSKECELWENS